MTCGQTFATHRVMSSVIQLICIKRNFQHLSISSDCFLVWTMKENFISHDHRMNSFLFQPFGLASRFLSIWKHTCLFWQNKYCMFMHPLCSRVSDKKKPIENLIQSWLTSRLPQPTAIETLDNKDNSFGPTDKKSDTVCEGSKTIFAYLSNFLVFLETRVNLISRGFGLCAKSSG